MTVAVRLLWSFGIGAVLLLMCAAPVRADVVQEYVFETGKTFPVRTALGITTQIVLVGDDEVEDYSIGFSGGWDVSRRGQVLYVRPKNVDVDTNLIVRTRARTYIMDLKVVASNWRKLDQAKQAGVQYRVVFAPERSADVMTVAGRRIDATSARTPTSRIGFDPAKSYVFDYDVALSKGAEALAPKNVYDDGVFTVLILKRSAGKSGMIQPAVFARRSADGGDMVVNTRVEGDNVIVHGVYPYLALRNGSQLVLLRRNPKR